MIVNKIYINTYKKDIRWCYLCLTSIRFWYPNIEIVLIKDLSKGDFDTTQVEHLFNISVFETKQKFGWGYGKLEPLFSDLNESFLVLDSDTLMIGPFISKVENINSSFIVDYEIQNSNRFNEIYYERLKICQINSKFTSQEYSFNTGQWFGTSNIICRDEFSTTISWQFPRLNKFPEIIKNGEQGHLNYHFHRLEQLQKISVYKLKIMHYPLNNRLNFSCYELRHRRIDKNQSIIIHWAGIKKSIFFMPENKFLFFYLNEYRKKTNLLSVIHLLFKLTFNF